MIVLYDRKFKKGLGSSFQVVPFISKVFFKEYSLKENLGREVEILAQMSTVAALKRLFFTKFGGFNVPTADRLLIDPSIVKFSSSASRISRQDCRQISQLVKSNGNRAFLFDTLALGHHFSSLQHENEKLRGDNEKIRSELRYEIDEVTAGLRLDLNLEKGHIRDELANPSADFSNLNNKIDQAIHGCRAQLEATKNELIKFYIGSAVSISAVGLAVAIVRTSCN